MSGMLVVISGPSGVGKNTVVEKLHQAMPERYVYSVSATTRDPRGDEKDGVEYFFLNDGEFLHWISKDLFLEWAEYNDEFYGTPKHHVMEMIYEGKIVLAEIDVKGAMQIMQTDLKKLCIFLMPPDQEELLNRLTNRGTDAEEEIEKRLEIAKWEMSQAVKFDEIVVNDDLDATVAEIQDLINIRLKP